MSPQDLGHNHHHHNSVFSFPITGHQQQEEEEEDKLGIQGCFQATPLVVAINDEEEDDAPAVYEATAGMLSEMFNFPSSAAAGATHLLHHHHHHQAETAAAAAAMSSDSGMQLNYLMNPAAQSQTRWPLPNNTSSMLNIPANPNPNNLLNSSSSLQQGAAFTMGLPTGYVEAQGLSLSLSSNMLHHLYTNNPPPAEANVHVAYGSSLGAVNVVLRNSKYLKAARELLEEFCSVIGTSDQFNITKQVVASAAAGGGRSKSNPKNNAAAAASSNYNNSSSSSTSKDNTPPLLPAAHRMEHHTRKVKLLAMLHEVEGRYKHYCEEMQMVVNTFELVMGLGAAVGYTALAEKAMSRHFRCLKDGIAAQLKHSCELLGETSVSFSSGAGITKGDTPRLKMLDHTLRQQQNRATTAFHQLPDNQDPWRPQCGLPDRSVTILRAWLFDHFLHPYPSDADKHLLARQTGLSRNQVSNWFINARVRLWKPMVEEMYQQEAKEDSNDSNNNTNQQEEDEEEEEERESSRNPNPSSSKSNSTSPHDAQTPTPVHHHHLHQRCHNNNNNNGSESDPSFFSGNHPPSSSSEAAVIVNHHHHHRAATGFGGSSSSGIIRFGGPTSGDVSLTLGLRHPGNNCAPPPPPHNHSPL